jgi:hypothetical protein
MLDRQVQRFLDSESSGSSGGKDKARRKGAFGAGLRTVGVRVRCRRGDAESGEGERCEGEKLNSGESEADEGDSEEEDDDGNDEMIWWSWDGKLVGFSD